MKTISQLEKDKNLMDNSANYELTKTHQQKRKAKPTVTNSPFTLRLGGEENINIFDVAADYSIHFPPYLWNKLTSEQQKLAKIVANPVRGKQDPTTEKDNNALLYGAGGTGKTSIVRKLAYNANCYPLIEIKGPSLTPRKEDYSNGIDPLNKFVFTLCDIENTLEDDYNFSRESNSEVRYIFFVDEADNVCSNTALPTEYTRLIFLKSCMEGISKESQSQNL
ncbi:8776_t:CDS:2 [Ambispora gerdemannii]|uniref:8776_t:CDS:1 n=1 Tax=Ambispora gerdemannii TaxID=144530 RepID=A0A9N9H2H2_9GLOM|nr:8776_t:CDS:2 [Ambispora gerdemannii]